jgi:hypothetical protein
MFIAPDAFKSTSSLRRSEMFYDHAARFRGLSKKSRRRESNPALRLLPIDPVGSFARFKFSSLIQT